MRPGEVRRLTYLGGKAIGGIDCRSDGGQVAFSCQVDRKTDIYVMDVDGGNLRRLTTGGTGPGDGMFYSPCFNPDGALIVCGRADAYHEEISDVCILDVETVHQRQVTFTGRDSQALFSPDGSHIICVSRRDGIPELYRFSLDGGEQKRLTHTRTAAADRAASGLRHRITSPTYSPDGQYIVYASSHHSPPGSCDFEIYRMRPDGSDSARLSFTKDSSSYPLVTPDNQQVAFTCSSWMESTRKNKVDIYIVNIDGSNQRCLEESQSVNWLRSFSPDGRFLALDSSRHNRAIDVVKRWDIFLLEISTGRVTRMTDNEVLDREPLFVPDGSGIIFESNRDGGTELYRLQLER